MKKYSEYEFFFLTIRETLIRLGFKFLSHCDERDNYIYNDSFLTLFTDRPSKNEVATANKSFLYKGQALGGITHHCLAKASEIGYTWLKSSPNLNTLVGYRCQPFEFVMEVWGNLCGNMWRQYNKGQRQFGSIVLDDNLKQNSLLKEPIISHTYKTSTGRVKHISKEQLLTDKRATSAQYNIIKDYSIEFFDQGAGLAKNLDLILARSKYHFGTAGNGIIRQIGRIHYPSASLYFPVKNFHSTCSKQFIMKKPDVQQWVMLKENHRGHENVHCPIMPVNDKSIDYIVQYECMTDKKFVPQDWTIDDFIASIVNAVDK